jgi:hypothetical protein
MAWARVTSATVAANKAGDATASFNGGNLGASTLAGDRIIAVVDASVVASQPHIIGMSATGGGGIEWARDFLLFGAHNGYFEELAVWSGVQQVDGAVTAITFATAAALPSGSSGISCAIGAYRGLAVGVGLGVDQNGLQDLVFGGFETTTPLNLADSKATLVSCNKPNQLVIGAYGDAGASLTLTAGAGFSTFVKTDANSNGECLLEDKDSGAPGLPQQATVAMSGTGFFMMGVVVYRTFAGNTQPFARRPMAFAPGLAR